MAETMTEIEQDEFLTRFWDAIIKRAERGGVAPVKDQLWVFEVGDFIVALNGFSVRQRFRDFEVLPYHAAVWSKHLDLPIAHLHPLNGFVLGGEHHRTAMLEALEKNCG